MILERLINLAKKCQIRKISTIVCALILTVTTVYSSEAKNEKSVNCPIYTMGECEGRYIALTFDNGPHPSKTNEILDILSDNQIKATFFVVGKNAYDNEEIVERIINEGHEIGNHTFCHKYLSGEGRSLVEREIDLCDDVIYNHSEYSTNIFRPPGGLYDDTLIDICAERGYSVVLWSIDTRDWAGTSTADICSEIYKYVQNGSIILMHDYVCCESHTAEALREVIPKLKELGYCFVTISELIGN